MITNDLASARIYTDFQGFTELRSAVRNDSPAVLHEVATQFEALFVQMMLKSMRAASLADGIFQTDQEELYLGLFDQQIAIDMAAKQSFGIAEMLTRHVAGRIALEDNRNAPGTTPLSREARADRASGRNREIKHDARIEFNSADEFVTYIRPMAERAAIKLGTSPAILVAQAALETGWGRRIIHDGEGRNSFNLFGIKSDARWGGPEVNVTTLEYSDDRAQKKVAAFRVYESYQQSFEDYVDFIRRNAHYRTALQNGDDASAYIHGLQQAGYATDPHYAEKVVDIMNRISL